MSVACTFCHKEKDPDGKWLALFQLHDYRWICQFCASHYDWTQEPRLTIIQDGTVIRG